MCKIMCKIHSDVSLQENLIIKSKHKSILKKSDSSSALLTRNSFSKHVSFSDVQIRGYDITIGDHPDCSMGPPISLGWDFYQYPSINLEQYEIYRPPRRTLRQLMLNYYQRMYILEQSVVLSKEDIKVAVRNVKKAKLQRKCTRLFLPIWRLEDIAQSAKRKMKRIKYKCYDHF